MTAREWWREKASPVIALLLTALLIGACVGFAARANADPVSDYAAVNAERVCAVLENHPTVDGVTGILAGVIQDSGFPPYQAGRIVGMAVMMACPEYLPVLQRFIDRYAPPPEFRQGYIA